MSTFFEELRRALDSGRPVALATIIESKGSTPREVGAKMIIRAEGQILGSVGGGCGEAQVIWDAARVLAEKTPRISEVDLTGEINDESPTNCGGIMDIFVERLQWEGEDRPGLPTRQVVEELLALTERRGRGVLLTVVGGDPGLLGARALIRADGTFLGPAFGDDLREALIKRTDEALTAGRSRRLQLEAGGRALDAFLEVFQPPAELLIVGAGHIAVPLARMGKLLDLEVAVLDDRSAFANRQRFPDAERVIAANIEKTLRDYPITASTHIVLVTRGHQMDQAALKVVIRSEAGYIGMIGSKRRVRAVFDHLLREGIPPEVISRVHAPIGLDIGAETPAEIAVSILGQIINLRRRGRGTSLSDRVHALRAPAPSHPTS